MHMLLADPHYQASDIVYGRISSKSVYRPKRDGTDGDDLSTASQPGITGIVSDDADDAIVSRVSGSRPSPTAHAEG